jgi:hypothetical protein
MGYFKARAVLVDHQVVRLEPQKIGLHGDPPKPLDRCFFAAAKPSERMHLFRNVDHVAEIVRQVACQAIEVLSPPGIVNVADDGFRLGHDCAPHDPRNVTLA